MTFSGSSDKKGCFKLKGAQRLHRGGSIWVEPGEMEGIFPHSCRKLARIQLAAVQGRPWRQDVGWMPGRTGYSGWLEYGTELVRPGDGVEGWRSPGAAPLSSPTWPTTPRVKDLFMGQQKCLKRSQWAPGHSREAERKATCVVGWSLRVFFFIFHSAEMSFSHLLFFIKESCILVQACTAKWLRVLGLGFVFHRPI